MNYFLAILICLTSSISNSQTIYKFDSKSQVNGCGNVLLQKISNDNPYELRIEIIIDSLPNKSEFDINEHNKFIAVFFNTYPQYGSFISPICSDIIIGSGKNPQRRRAVSGIINIIDWNKNDSTISVSANNLIFYDEEKHKIKIPFELFSNVKIGWEGG